MFWIYHSCNSTSNSSISKYLYSLPVNLGIHFLCTDQALVFQSSATTPYEAGNSICTYFQNTSKTKCNIPARIYLIVMSNNSYLMFECWLFKFCVLPDISQRPFVYLLAQLYPVESLPSFFSFFLTDFSEIFWRHCDFFLAVVLL